MEETQATLRRLERHDWWLWVAAILVMLLLTAAVVILSFFLVTKETNASFQFNLSQEVRGLAALVLLFSIYAIYQQILIKQLRHQLADQLGASAELRVRAEEFQDKAIRDPLTGLYNRRLAEDRLLAEVTRSKRHGHPLAVLALDLNDFKLINDRYGHAAGDLVLKGLADRLKQSIRVPDVVARIGGDEFLVLLPECHVGQVERVVARLEGLDAEFHGQRIPFTVSTGWADYQPGESPEQLLERADQKLYVDKRTRKGQQSLVPDAR